MVSVSGTVDPAENCGKTDITSELQIISAGRAIGAWTASVIKGSFCYRWLTKEPEPEVIVIDLRESYTAGHSSHY
ncbi:hypothetical protein Harman_27220 [Haloarcula mannanilytica]|uniref:Uncharacterized protein n=1 Tax=Haloarcula mannanilytica TaxID=2509225 RepID=A0A4C2EMC9_9EURY|nr:hypothetical protein Harman_27220 [Haloarcula mannanilytica]